MKSPLPNTEVMYKALLEKDSGFEGIFFVGVKTTGIFCRPTCTAKKPKKSNVEFFSTANDALLCGYKPCQICHPQAPSGKIPEWLNPLFKEINKNPDIRLKDIDLKNLGFEPNRVRRWFKTNLGMTFQAYLRTLRIGNAFGRIKYGNKVIEAAFESGYESLSGFTASFKKNIGFAPQMSHDKHIIKVTRILTPLGPMIAGGTQNGICLLEFLDRKMIETQLKRIRINTKSQMIPGNNKFFKPLYQQLKEYFKGERKRFTIPLELTGTPFQKKVWTVLQTIPYGSTRSYREMAQKVGNPRAIRATAKANGDNKIAIIIPCHRVIGHDGKLTGYGGGLWRKQYLLNLESKNSA